MAKIRISLSLKDIELLLELVNKYQAWDCYYDTYLYACYPDKDARRKRIEAYLKTKLPKERKE